MEVTLGLDIPGLKQMTADIAAFLSAFGLTSLVSEVDHAAYKCDSADYERVVESVMPAAASVMETVWDDHRLSTVVLRIRADLGPLGSCRLIEVMEICPDRDGIDAIGWNHVEAVVKDLDPVTSALHAKGLKPRLDLDHRFRDTAVVPVNGRLDRQNNLNGQEIKFTTLGLLRVNVRQKEKGAGPRELVRR